MSPPSSSSDPVTGDEGPVSDREAGPEAPVDGAGPEGIEGEDSEAGDSDFGRTDGPDVRVTESPSGRREVVVPLELYKTVTVFSTLIAIAGVLLGFVLLDAATLQVSLLRAVLAGTLRAVGLGLAPATLSSLLGVLGVLAIAAGAGVYVLGTRFRAAAMGNAEEDADEPSDDG